MKIKDKLKNIMKIGAIALTLYACGDINGPLVNYKKPEKKPMSINYAPIIQSTPELEILINKGYHDYVNGIWKYNNAIYKYDVNAVDLNGDPINYYLTKSPQGMTINSETGEIEFPLEFKDLGKHEINVIADDGNSKTEQNFILDVKYPYIDEFGDPIAEYDFVKGNDEMVLICEKSCSFGFTYPVNLYGNIITSDEDYFNKKWQGLNLGLSELKNFTGITPDYTLKPIELHLEADTRCIDYGSSGYFKGDITKNEGYSPLQGRLCMFNIGQTGLDPISIQDQLLFIHEMTHALQAYRLPLFYFDNFKESQAYNISYMITGWDGTFDWKGLGSYCYVNLSDINPNYNVYRDLCNTCNYDKVNESLFWAKVIENYPNPYISDIVQILSLSQVTTCSQQDIEQIFINNKFYQCSDGLDNNGNGLIDLEDVDYCTGPTDESESN